MRIERFVPAPLKNPYRRLRSAIKNMAFGRRNSEIFDEIYRRRAWGGPDNDATPYSGPGTYDPSVSEYVAYILSFIEKNRIKTIVEIGCGDFAIGRQYACKVARYVGVDISSVVIENNRRRNSSDTISFIHGDAGELDIGTADLCIIRQVLQHLDNSSIKRILRKAAAHRNILITEHLPSARHLNTPNLDKRTGPDTRLIFDSGVYVELPPFNQFAETVLSLPVQVTQAHPGEIMRTSLIKRS
jgi:SAM-dependent methyltransferase